MSTLAQTPREIAALPGERSSRPSLFRHLIEARERQARRLVETYLAAPMDGRRLGLGPTASESQALRRQIR